MVLQIFWSSASTPDIFLAFFAEALPGGKALGERPDGGLLAFFYPIGLC